MEAVFLKLLNMSITAGWLCLAVVLLRFVLKKAPKAIVCTLWALVAIRLVLPFSIESVVSLIPSAETIPNDIVYSQTPQIHSGISSVNSSINPIILETLAPRAESSVNPMQVITFVASVVWIVGMAAMLVYTCVSYLRIHRKVREAVRMKDNIWLCDHIDTPFILGIIRPRIFLPSSMNEIDAEYVIAHERAHLKRLDHIWKPLGFLLLTVYWFNPILWAAHILLCRDIELACDEKVIKQMGSEIKKPYSEALINCSVPRRMISACPLAFGEVGVKGRIKSVLNYKKPAFWIIIVAIVALIVTAVCFLTDPKEEKNNSYKLSNSYYTACEIVYTPTSWIIPVEFMPEFYVSEDNDLYSIDDDGVETYLGRLKQTELTKSDFDGLFSYEGWNTIPQELRKNINTAWQLTPENSEEVEVGVYYILVQNNGEIYIVYGDYGDGEKMIRWIYKFNRRSPAVLAWKGDFSDEKLTEAINTYKANRTPFIYSQDSEYGTVSFEADFDVYSCKVCRVSKAYDDDINVELEGYIDRLVDSKTDGKKVTVDVGWWETEGDSWVQDYPVWSYLLLLTDADGNSYYYYFRVDYKSSAGNGKDTIIKWVDYYENGLGMNWDSVSKIELPEFPEVTFTYTPYKVETTNNVETKTLLWGMPVWNVYLMDLTDDGLPEFCATVSVGSGMVDSRIIVADYYNDKTYTLEDRGEYDYFLRMVDGNLVVVQTKYRVHTALAVGKLALVPSEGSDELRLEMISDDIE